MTTAFPVAGFGISAGGVEAFAQVLSNLPPDTGIAYILVQHLDPGHQSVTEDLLERVTSMPVAQAKPGMKVNPDHVYLGPPNIGIAFRKGRLRMSKRLLSRGHHLPVDGFLKSVAEECGPRSIGVILSGNAPDGVSGVKAIKKAGGITFAQSAESAKYPVMPATAIDAGAIDYVLAPEEIARELARIGKPAAAAGGAATDLSDIFKLLRSATGVDFANYKQTTIRRRIARRMVIQRLKSRADYVAFLQNHPEEIQALCDHILIKVTRFFRDPDVFRALRKTIFPRLLKRCSPSDPMRIWISGCSTGEEAYSVGISLLEAMHDTSLDVPVKILASDISNSRLDTARAGIYPRAIESDVPPELLGRYFTAIESGYQVKRAVRDMCVFARQDMTRDAPFSKLDLVVCRNVLIYFTPQIQRKTLETLHYALKPTGYMLLGSAETGGPVTSLFLPADRKNKGFFKKRGSDRLAPDAPVTRPISKPFESARPLRNRTAAEVMGEADRIVLGKFAPTGIVVNDQMKVLQFRGRTGKYLEPEAGEAGFNLFRMAREGLLHDLRSAIHTARNNDAPVRKPNVHVLHEGGLSNVTLEVIPLYKSSAEGRHFLILFEEADPHVSRTGPKTEGTLEARRLRRELTAIRETLRSTIEELESNNEQLRSANEEIQSRNEELQSANEEMETAKEELQSTNEELTTANEELHHRNGELAGLNNDLTNLLASVQFPLVMVDRELRIRRFTPAAETVLRLIPTDIGRPLLDIKPDVEIPDLRTMLRNVIDRLQVIEQEVRDSAGRSYSLWIGPYRTADHKIDGAVLALADVTALRESLERTRDLRQYAEAIASTVREPLLVLDCDLKVITANGPFYRTFGLSPEQIVNQHVFEIGSGDWNIPQLRSILTAPPADEGFTQGLEVDYRAGRMGQKTLLINIRKVPEDGKAPIFLLAIEDTSARRLAEDTLRESQAHISAFKRQAPVGILQNNTKGDCIFANAEACRIAGVTPEEALGSGWTKHVHPDDRSLLSSSKEAALQDGEGLSFEFRFQFPDGGVAWAHQVSVRLHDRAGTTAGYLSAISDITERKNLEEQLRQAQKMEAIGRLAGGVAHDFNNMLTAISGYASQLLAVLPEAGPARKAAEQISKVGDQAALLTRQLLAFSRKQVLRPHREKLNDVLTDMREILLRLLGESVEVVLKLAPKVGSVVVDSGQIQQVILNLAINARDAMPAGGRLTLTTSNVSLDTPSAAQLGLSEGEYVALAVTDTGMGIAPGIRDRLFEPFFTTKAEGAGTGLGLSTVYGIVRQSGGTIRVESELGRGTTFRIYLPRVDAQAEPRTKKKEDIIPGGSETILLVEDAAVVRSLIRELLEQRGYRVLEARDGAEALSLAQTHDGPIHVLLTDLLMPRMSGNQLAKRIRRKRQGIRVIYMSGYSGEALQEVEQEANFLGKPFKPNTLAAVIRRSLDEPVK